MLLVDGNGTEQIFLAPQVAGDPFTPLALDHSELRQLESGLFVRRMLDGTIYEFNAQNKLAFVRDRNNNVTEYVYEDNKLKEIIDPVGLVTEFVYSGDQVVKIIDPAGRETHLSYLVNDRGEHQLVSITDPDDAQRTFSYKSVDASVETIGAFENLLTSQVHRRGNDAQESQPDAFDETIEYNEYGRVVGGTRIDDKSFVLTPAQMLAVADLELTTNHTTAPELVLLTRPGTENSTAARCNCPGASNTTGTSPTTDYLAEARYVDHRGETTTFLMNGFGQYVSSKDDENGDRAFARSQTGGQITAEIDHLGNVVCYEYDIYGNTIAITDYPDGPGSSRAVRQTFEYDVRKANQLARSVDGVGRVTVNELDSRGNILKTTVTDPHAAAGQPTSTHKSFTRLPNGLVESETDAMGNTVSYQYDQYGRMTRINYVDGHVTTQYDDPVYHGLTGQVTAITDEAGQRIEMTYDAMNRETEKRFPVPSEQLTYTATTQHDAAGNPVRLKNRNGTIIEYEYDALNRPIRRVEAVGDLDYVTRWGYEYDALDTDYEVPWDDTYSYEYEMNPRGDVSVKVSDKDNLLVYTFDTIGRKTSYQYDEADRQTDVVLPSGAVIHEDLDGWRVIRRTGPTVEAIRYTYDDANRTTQQVVENDVADDQVTEWVHNLFDQPARRVDPEGHVTEFSYDAAGRLTQRVDAAESSKRFETTFTYDGRNRVIRKSEGGVRRRFGRRVLSERIGAGDD